MKDSFFGRHLTPPPVSSIETFRRKHLGPGDLSLVRKFHESRDELAALRRRHAEFVKSTREE
jgi:hypothetical protein